MQFLYLAFGVLALIAAALVQAFVPKALVGDVVAMGRLATIGTGALVILGVGCLLVSCFPSKRTRRS